MPQSFTVGPCACCGGSSSSGSSGATPTVQTDCCANPIPQTLFLTMTDDGSCACMEGVYELTWDPTLVVSGGFPFVDGPGAWASPLQTVCGGSWRFALACDSFSGSPAWYLCLVNATGDGCFFAQGTASPVTCDPFLGVWSILYDNLFFCFIQLGISGCTGTTLTFTITE